MKIECIYWELEAEENVVDDADSDGPRDTILIKDTVSIKRPTAKLAASQYENMSVDE